MHTAPNNGYKALLLINYFLRIKVTLHSQALANIFQKGDPDDKL